MRISGQTDTVNTSTKYGSIGTDTVTQKETIVVDLGYIDPGFLWVAEFKLITVPVIVKIK
jgi:hypothetical protein